MAEMACAVCGERFDEDELLFSDRGRICERCELDLKEQSTLNRGIWFTVINGPITAITGTVMACVPVVGPLLMLALGAIALWRGTSALQVTWYGWNDEALGGGAKALLLASGIITSVWAVGLVMGGGVGAVITLWATLHH